MKKVDLNSPILRTSELNYQEFDYKILNHHYLSEPAFRDFPTFENVIDNRETKRTFKTLSEEKLNSILWYSSRTIRFSESSQPRWEHRPSPSAGGKHPIDLFIFNPLKNREILLYRNLTHALASIQTNEVERLGLLKEVKKILDIQSGTLIWFGAQFDRTLSRYKNGESLVWRDTGVLTAFIILTAAAINVNACPVGITGEPYFSKCLGTKQVIGVGGICLGES